MLSTAKTRYFFWGLYLTIICLQFLLAWDNDLFADEAFYWLESHFLQLSYSEVPGFVPWLNAVSGWLFPRQPIFLRLPYLMAAWSLPWLAFYISKFLTTETSRDYLAALLTLCLPLLGLIGVLAIADIWILFFAFSAVLFLLRFMQSNQTFDALILGLILACGVNVHIRFWFVLFIAFIGAVVVWRQQVLYRKKLWQVTAPILLLGFLPILLFNINNHFPLLSFQLGERNPWQFQVTHFWFFPVQLLLTTPLVFALCLFALKRPTSTNKNHNEAFRFIQLTALLYWLLYALLGFFSDNLRTSAHWPLLSYALLLVVAAHVYNQHKLQKWTAITGFISHASLLLGFYGLLHFIPVTSNAHKQLISNAIGWRQLNSHVQELRQPGQKLLADQFMTAAALNYYSQKDAQDYIKSLPHPLNDKHGRQQQLRMMGLLAESSVPKDSLLVVEHTALKLTAQIDFYRQSCRQLGGLELIDDLSIKDGAKIYYFFLTGHKKCQLPPITYHQYSQNKHTGWVLAVNSSEQQIHFEQVGDIDKKTLTINQQPLGENPLFSDLSPTDYALYHYQSASEGGFQLRIHQGIQTIISQRYWP